MGFLSIVDYYQRKPSRQILTNTLYGINKEYSAINFIASESKVRSDIEKEIKLQRYYFSSVIRTWISVIVLGLFIGILGSVQSLLIEEIYVIKNDALKRTLQTSIVGGGTLWVAWTVVPILICTFLIIKIAPTIKGCGIASTAAYLNGVKIHRFHKASTLWILYISIFLVSIAHMPGGREELVIHLGALCGAFITRMKIPFTNWRPFISVSNPINMRNLVAAGTAAGVSVSFGTPIGAVLFCLEEGLSFWTPEVTSLMFLCAICANFVLHLTYTLYYRAGVNFHNIMSYLFFSGADHISLTFNFSEIPIFVSMGVIGGLLGALWNEVQILLHRFRKKYVKTNQHKILEVIVLGFDISVFGILIFYCFGAECTRIFKETDRIEESIHMKVYCKDKDEFETVGIFLFQDLRHTIKSLFLVNKEIINYSVILFGGIYYYVFAQLQLGTCLPNGVLIPHLICGACWGYLVGIFYSKAVVENVVVAKYAFLGAVAQGSGVARLTLSLGIIMIESCGQQMFSLPIFIIVITAKWLGGVFSRPIYRIETYLEGYPFLRSTYLPISTPYKAKHIMISPMDYLTPQMTVKGLLSALKKKHQVYPVIKNDKVVGVLTKYQIAIILKSKIYNFPDNVNQIRLMHKMMIEYESESFTELGQVIHSPMYNSDANRGIDLTDFMSTSTYLIHMEMSLRKIYLMFVALGLTYVIVIDDNFQAHGIITRKDIACFRKLSQFMLMRTEVLSFM